MLDPEGPVPIAVLKEALGTADADFLSGFLLQLANAASTGNRDEEMLNFMVSVVKGINPRDQVETMLAAQMAVIHRTFMSYARRVANEGPIEEVEFAERGLNKFARTFTRQMEALNSYRMGAEERVTVQHVSVSKGSQANRG